MSYSLRGSCFGGQASLGGVGGLWDDFVAQTTGSSSSTPTPPSSGSFTSCPSGYAYQYSPSTNSGTCVPYSDTRVSIDTVEVDPKTTVVKGGCPKGFAKVDFSPTYSECIADANQVDSVVTVSPTYGPSIYLPGSTSQAPSYFCPAGYIMGDGGKCTKDPKYVAPGTKPTVPSVPGTVVKPAPKPGGGVATLPPADEAGLGDALPLLAAAALFAGGVYLASRNKRSGRAAA